VSASDTISSLLDTADWRCLRRIAEGRDAGVLSPLDATCSAESLQYLKSLGLIERGSSPCQPPETKHACYRITSQGAAVLRRHDQGP
jgi:hypothetical protein